MRLSNNLALKEWAPIVRALDRGRQTLLLRKGGIHEKELVPTHREFFFFPTYVHPMVQGVVGADPLDLAEASPGFLEIHNYAQVEGVFWLDRFELLSSLQPFHIWTPETVHRRFFYKRPGLYLFLLRVYRLPQKVRLPMSKRYGGCRSWVKLERELPTLGAVPVLDPEAFALQMERVQRALREAASGGSYKR